MPKGSVSNRDRLESNFSGRPAELDRALSTVPGSGLGVERDRSDFGSAYNAPEYNPSSRVWVAQPVAGGGGGGALAPVTPYSSPERSYRARGLSVPEAARGNPFLARNLVVGAYPLRDGSALPQAGTGYGLMEDGRATVFTAADRSLGDRVHPENIAPGRTHGAFNVYNPETGEFDETSGFSLGGAIGEGAGLPFTFPFGAIVSTVGGMIGRAIDPPHPVGIDVLRGVGGSAPPLSEGWNLPTERDSWDNEMERRRKMDRMDSPWGAPLTEQDPKADGPDEQEPDKPDYSSPLLYTPYPGDYTRYGFGPEHLFLRRRTGALT